ncbi:hypothetical protein CC2G_008285 [Coprinopsis cinerea AmutBmut pab1-1]|nr:hypothetical protein CC2G_008285 [Coprinopsis cinerea AmutBmut pab1-1]
MPPQATIKDLPNELLHRIFGNMVDPVNRATPSSMVLEAKGLLSGTQVCRLWSTFLPAQPDLWGCILQPGFPNLLFDTVLQRSGTSPISVVYTSPSEPLSWQSERDIEFTSRLQRNFTILLSKATRWSTFFVHLRHNATDILDIETLQQSLVTPAPLLRSFTLLYSPNGITLGPQPYNLLVGSQDEPHPIRTLQLWGPEALSPSMHIHQRLTNITSLFLHSGTFGGTYSADNVLRECYSPKYLALFVSRLNSLEELTLAGCINWVESNPGIRTFFMQGPAPSQSTPATRYRLNLKHFFLYDSLFSCYRFLQYLSLPSDGSCKIKIHASLLTLTSWDPHGDGNVIRDALSTFTELIPITPVGCLSLGLGHLFFVRFERERSIVFDLKADLTALSSSSDSEGTTEHLSRIYADILPPRIESWTLQDTRAVRLRVSMDIGQKTEESFEGIALERIGDSLFRKCREAQLLHLYGVSHLAFQALAGCYYGKGAFKVYDCLPKLSTVIILGESFIDDSNYHHSDYHDSNYLYSSNFFKFRTLNRFLEARLAKRNDVSQISGLYYVDFDDNDLGIEMLRRELLPSLSFDDQCKFGIVSRYQYYTQDSGYKCETVCQYCCHFGAWHAELPSWMTSGSLEILGSGRLLCLCDLK